MLWILLDYALFISVLNHPCIHCMHMIRWWPRACQRQTRNTRRWPKSTRRMSSFVGVRKSFTNFQLFGSCLRQVSVYNLYFLALIMFVYALSFEEKDLHHLCSFDKKQNLFLLKYGLVKGTTNYFVNQNLGQIIVKWNLNKCV